MTELQRDWQKKKEFYKDRTRRHVCRLVKTQKEEEVLEEEEDEDDEEEDEEEEEDDDDDDDDEEEEEEEEEVVIHPCGVFAMIATFQIIV